MSDFNKTQRFSYLSLLKFAGLTAVNQKNSSSTVDVFLKEEHTYGAVVSMVAVDVL